MPAQAVFKLSELPQNSKRTVTVDDTKILLVRTEDTQGRPTLFAVEAECPHAKAPIEKGAVCNGRLVCPWHAGTFELSTGRLLEPPPLRDLKRYAVQFVNDELWVDPVPLQPETPTPVGEGKSLVFAGAGAATAAALAALRDAHFAGRVTIVDPVGDEPVDRTQLTKNALAGKKALTELPLFPSASKAGAETLSPLHLEWKRASVVRLDRSNRQMELSTGERVAYDAALIATGGRPKLPKIAGSTLPHVFTIRHTGDLDRMAPRLKEEQRVVLIGDSFIAFEAASALRQRGLATTILAKGEQPFAKKFGSEVSKALLSLHRSHGVVVQTGVEVQAIGPVSVELQNGGDVPADIVVIAIGVEPVLEFADDLPRDQDGGLAVTSNLQLAPNLWCAGDIASVQGTRVEHWRLAEQHGRTVAAAMLDFVQNQPLESAPKYEGVPFFWTAHFGTRLNYAGHAETWDRISFVGDPQDLNFVAVYEKGDQVAAVLACKRDTAMAALMEPLRQPLQPARAMEIVAAAG